MTKTQIKAVESWLDDRFESALHRDEEMGNANGTDFLPSNPDYIYYKGAINLLECAGFTWVRSCNGTHTVYK